MNASIRRCGVLSCIVVAACFLALFGCGSGSSGNSSTSGTNDFTGRVVGTVTIANTGPAVSGGTVILTPQTSITLPAMTATTDSNGNFEFDSVPVGSWLISVKNAQLTTANSRVIVTANTTTSVAVSVAALVTQTN